MYPYAKSTSKILCRNRLSCIVSKGIFGSVKRLKQPSLLRTIGFDVNTFDVTSFRRFVRPPDKTSNSIQRSAFSVIEFYEDIFPSAPKNANATKLLMLHLILGNPNSFSLVLD